MSGKLRPPSNIKSLWGRSPDFQVAGVQLRHDSLSHAVQRERVYLLRPGVPEPPTHRHSISTLWVCVCCAGAHVTITGHSLGHSYQTSCTFHALRNDFKGPCQLLTT